MLADETSELAALRAEIVKIRRDLDDALERLDLPSSRSPYSEWPKYPTMDFEQINVRHHEKHYPVVLRSDDTESGVCLYDVNRQPRARLVVHADGHAELEILNAQGKVAVSIGEGDDGRGDVRVNAADGTPRAGLRSNEGGGIVTVVDERGGMVAAMLGHPDGGHLFICTPQQQPTVILKSGEHGGFIAVGEPSGQMMGTLSVSVSGASLILAGEQGEPVVSVTGAGEAGGVIAFCTSDGAPKAILP